MKDKKRQKIKSTRNRFKKRMMEFEYDNLTKLGKAYAKSIGVNDKIITSKAVRSAYNKTQKSAQGDIVLYSIIVAMGILRREKRYGASKLDIYREHTMEVCEVIGHGQRSPVQLMEELKIETKLDIKPFFEEKTSRLHFNSLKETATDIHKALLWEKIALGAIVVLYPLYFYYGWKEKRIRAFAEVFRDEIIKILNKGSVNDWITYINKECRIHIKPQFSLEDKKYKDMRIKSNMRMNNKQSIFIPSILNQGTDMINNIKPDKSLAVFMPE